MEELPEYLGSKDFLISVNILFLFQAFVLKKFRRLIALRNLKGDTGSLEQEESHPRASPSAPRKDRCNALKHSSISLHLSPVSLALEF